MRHNDELATRSTQRRQPMESCQSVICSRLCSSLLLLLALLCLALGEGLAVAGLGLGLCLLLWGAARRQWRWLEWRPLLWLMTGATLVMALTSATSPLGNMWLRSRRA